MQLLSVSPCVVDLTPPPTPLSDTTQRITGRQSSPAGQAIGAPVIELTTRSRAQPFFSPLVDVRERHTSLDFLRSSFYPFIPSPPLFVCLASGATPSEGSLAGAAERFRCGRTLSPVRFRLVFAHCSRGSHLQQSRLRPPGHLIRGPDFAWRPPPLRATARRFGGGLAIVQASGQTPYRKRRKALMYARSVFARQRCCSSAVRPIKSMCSELLRKLLYSASACTTFARKSDRLNSSAPCGKKSFISFHAPAIGLGGLCS